MGQSTWQQVSGWDDQGAPDCQSLAMLNLLAGKCNPFCVCWLGVAWKLKLLEDVVVPGCVLQNEQTQDLIQIEHVHLTNFVKQYQVAGLHQNHISTWKVTQMLSYEQNYLKQKNTEVTKYPSYSSQLTHNSLILAQLIYEIFQSNHLSMGDNY